MGLALSPAAATRAIAAPAAMAGCTMDHQQRHMPSNPDHSKMDCCTPACQMAAAAALPAEPGRASASPADGAVHNGAAVRALASFNVRGLDPPPRLTA